MRFLRKDIQSFIPLILYFGSMLLLIEWVLPLEQVTDTGETIAFILFIMLCFFLSAVFMPRWLRFPLKLAGMLLLVHYLFMAESFLSRAWFTELFADFKINMTNVFSQQWMELTPLFRTFLFLILLWMMSYLLYYWFVIRKKPLSFILITFIYLTVLDTFTTFDAKHAIIRAFIISAILLSSAHFSRILERENLKLPSFKRLTKWVSPVLIVILFSTIIGYAAPKYDPIWPDPVPYLQSQAGGQGSGGSSTIGPQRIGYGTNDERLGGGFIWDESTVFYAQAQSSQYWKVETKDVYTGKGWVNSHDGVILPSEDGYVDRLMSYGDVVETRDGEARIQFIDPGNLDKIPYMYGTERFIPIDDLQYDYNLMTGAVYPFNNEGIQMPIVNGIDYESEISRPFFPTNRMREVEAEHVDEDFEQYLQLPETLPDRVVELAEEIVANETNRYEQAKAIEQYFARNGFTYEEIDVPVPGEDEDYVDQFLFETQRGYCDNFSTSMVVMLRAVDIPARWVKGFTGGERVIQDHVFDDGSWMPVYEVQNNHAHSWVEVYFPDIGWVPFEPTVGFSNEASFTLGDDIEDHLEDREYDVEEDEPTPEVETEIEREDGAEEEEEDETVVASNNTSFWNIFFIVAVSLIALIIIIRIIYRRRYLIVGKWKRQKLKQKKDLDSFSDAYQFLLKILSSKGLPLKEGQTLREYAQEIDRFFGISDMKSLTHYYERAIYSDELIDKHFKDAYQIWDKMTKKLTA